MTDRSIRLRPTAARHAPGRQLHVDGFHLGGEALAVRPLAAAPATSPTIED